MSALASLVRAYDRMAARGEVPSFGYSLEKISFLIALHPDGSVAHDPIDLRQSEGKKRSPTLLAVPQPPKRASGIAPNFLWDKTAYVLGVTAGEGKRTAKEHAAFISNHRNWLANSDDEGLQALLRFLESWTPAEFAARGWPDDMKDQNIVFALESERLVGIRLHDRPAARDLWGRLTTAKGKSEAVCLVTGHRGAVARLHPAIKGVWGAQSAGGSIVSFNLDAFKSYGNEQGDNAPVSEAAAFAYTSALNRFLARDSGHRIQVGDASTVFWADASDAAAAQAAEDIFGSFLAVDEKVEAGKIESLLAKLRAGRPIEDFRVDLPPNVCFFILGLAPNAARLSIRFYIEDDFGVIAQRYLRHLDRMRIDPPPRDEAPSLWKMLIETAVLRRSENIQPNLAGEWLRAILTDTPYPATLLSALIMRLRADHDVNAMRLAILKSILIRNFEVRAPVSLDPNCKEPGYLLGRLFAVYEHIQSMALGSNVNATIKDKFYGAASAQPRKVFHLLESGSANHLSKIGKQRPGLRVNLEKAVGAIMEVMSPDKDPFPASLPDKSQALFGLGYYHQRNEFFRKPANSDAGETQE
ncbi:type I-C CRISPR-associated protein Cas8c/Csd1 [Bradyrhizobium sp. U87765 SZCCT0131]|uniref:type I-C CRISPR-associated protein Cas8c/Csd1 n=1 Tax=unclassified Bradyrhizobium TaxID=2631580 RepID=UPI001BA624B2|nr:MULTISPECIES: type I-C CRISPR-associated protein Cas8c/Csd1 [unclassified Bradyrhizobium]MBR1217947.1 type I-C CRISPR-associated protein Cas8c/Csd1 [Bradyrhizobium sp. U87765 SZCCT0131]MBR1261107.1 type I-C CRISPR-associated protein Cas8c/Csd1 [Bradyrhizobium sp. U87765 SZCCT0134]MBR1303445.1 type I-C CRISPR-associated protein Cas8c/Csd1 [Bradyrhizobium sp. U87765 SZCCT0110]MBR1319051.1 type I-C CRISPR-associated protein Cas8c/Csd1 [Bradyrhizobium sp. U87765 SZCCT0109]MBR1347376.1 type I-C 